MEDLLLGSPSFVMMSRRMAPPAQAFVAIGSNVGDRVKALRNAVAVLSHGIVTGVVMARCSRVYETRPVGIQGEPFLNAVVELRCRLEPEALLTELLAIELAHGRKRTTKWQSRTLDLDFVCMVVNGEVLTRTSRSLVLPHPRAVERDFVLQPLADLAPDLVIDGRSVACHLIGFPSRNRTIMREISCSLGSESVMYRAEATKLRA